MSTNLEQLRKCDPELWFPGCARILQKPFQPHASKVPIPGVLCLKYRGNYYYSADRTHPFIMLKRHRGRKSANFPEWKYPLVTICNQVQYERFLTQRANDEFKDIQFEMIRSSPMAKL